MRLKAIMGNVVGAAVAALLLSACGDSSKPSYCSAVNNLKNSIEALPNTDVIQNGTNALKSAVTKVENDANAVVSAAKSDFSNEIDAVKTSVDSLSSTVKQLSSSPSAATLAQLPGEASAVATALKNLADATSSKCS